MLMELTRMNLRRHYEQVGKKSMLSVFNINATYTIVPTTVLTEDIDKSSLPSFSATKQRRFEQYTDTIAGSSPKACDTQMDVDASARACTHIRTSGAAKKKRNELKRKGLRLGVTEKFFIKEYSDRKAAKKKLRASWCAMGGDYTNMPKEYQKSTPAHHEPKRKRDRQDTRKR